MKVGVLAALGMSASALAAQDVSYNYLEASAGYGEIAGGADDGLVWGLNGSWELPSNFVISAGILQPRYDMLRLTQSHAGLGYRLPLGENFDLLAGASYQRMSALGNHVDGFGLELAARGFVTSQIELSAGIEYVDLESSRGVFHLQTGGRYYINPALAVGLDYRKPQMLPAESHFMASLRYDFGARR